MGPRFLRFELNRIVCGSRLGICANRFPVAMLLGVVVARALSESRRCSVIFGLAVLIPVVTESVMTLPATLDWFPIGRRQVSMLAGLLGPAIAAGTITGMISYRFLSSDRKVSDRS